MNIKNNEKLWAVETVYIDRNINLYWVPEKCFATRRKARDYANLLKRTQKLQTKVCLYVNNTWFSR